jgi:hypothetical protein
MASHKLNRNKDILGLVLASVEKTATSLSGRGCVGANPIFLASFTNLSRNR